MAQAPEMGGQGEAEQLGDGLLQAGGDHRRATLRLAMAYHPQWLKDYYSSPSWPERRRVYWRRRPGARRCRACNKRGIPIMLHHMQYAGFVHGVWFDLHRRSDWGKEPDEWLAPLCFDDHRNVHDLDNDGKHRTLRDATEAWIGQTQRRRERRDRLSRLRVVGWLFR